MRDYGALSGFDRNHNVSAWASIWRKFLLQLNSSGDAVTEAQIWSFLAQSREFAENLGSEARNIDKNCIDREWSNPANPVADAKTLFSTFIEARNKLKSENADAPKIYALTIIEPYIAGAVADISAFVHGHADKADFLASLARDYPRNDAMINAGIINLY